MPLQRPSLLVAVPLAALVLAWAATAAPARAQDRSTVVRVLRESRDFRARVRAAMALGASADPQMAGPLVAALSDESAAVRAAAASGLGRLGNPEALPALRRALADAEREVRDAAQRAVAAIGGARSAAAAASPPPGPISDPLRMPSVAVVPPQRDVDWTSARYVVVLGAMQNRSDFAPARAGSVDRLGRVLADEVRRHLVVLRGVAILPDGPTPPEAEREIARRRLPRMRLEGSVTRVQRQMRGPDLQVRCEVSLMLMDEPGRNLRAALQGAATGVERASGARAAQEVRLAEQALTGAVRSAMSGAARAIAESQ